MPIAHSEVMTVLVATLGESDCERGGAGALTQPVNAISSLAFTVAGLALVGWATGSGGRERWIRWAFVGTMVATGIGSFLYHGPQPTGSGFLHDITFLAALVVLAVANLGAGWRWSDRTVAVVITATIVGVGAILALAPGVTNWLTAAALVLLGVGDVVLLGRTGRGGAWYLTAIGLLALALVANVFGRTGSPLCEPGSIAQLHGLWHVLAAGALASYAVATGAVRRTAARTVPGGLG